MRTAKFLSGKYLAGLALASTLAMASPAAAQDNPLEFVASNVSFFDEVMLGDLVISPVNIFNDTRCADPEFCFRNNQFSISVIMFTEDGLQEVILNLFETTRVPGGSLTLTKTGTPPSEDNGAIELEKYQLELVYVRDPVPEEDDSAEAASPEGPVARESELPAQLGPARA